MGNWTFFSNYGHVLVCLSRNNEARLRDVAFEVGITERAVQKIVKDMQDAGFITVSKQGRCNRYRLNKRKSLRHALESHCNVGKLLALVTRPNPVRDQPGVAAERIADAKAPTRKVALQARPEPTAQTAKRSTPVPKPAQQSTPKASGGKKRSVKKDKPIDARQQGSLF